MQVARERGISFQIAAIWPGDRSYERQLKNKKSAPRFCPICRKAHDPNQFVMDIGAMSVNSRTKRAHPGFARSAARHTTRISS